MTTKHDALKSTKLSKQVNCTENLVCESRNKPASTVSSDSSLQKHASVKAKVKLALLDGNENETAACP